MQNQNTQADHESCLAEPLKGCDEGTLNLANSTCCITETMLRPLVDGTSETDTIFEATLLEERMDIMSTFVECDTPALETGILDLPISPEEYALLDSFEKFSFKDLINNESLKYIAGYVAYRFIHKYHTLGVKTHKMLPSRNAPDWIEFISKGNLMYPSEELIHATQILDKEFLHMHGESLSNDTRLFDSLAQRAIAKLPTSIQLPYEVIRCLARTRTYIRLRSLNKQISFANTKRKLERKLSKFTDRTK